MADVARVLGRIVYGGYFVYSGLHHFQQQEAMTQYAGSKQIPSPDKAVVGSGALMLVGGASVLSGIKPRAGLGMIALFLIGVTPTMHAFWNEADPQQKMAQQINFTKNLGLLGSTLMLLGSESCDEWDAIDPSDARYLPDPVA
jgi:uncharacterized membrane protein YphA (DoxX/SURF4 family)